MEGADIGTHTSWFNALARLVPQLITLEYVRIERYIWGLAPEIQGIVTSSKPTTIQDAREFSKTLTDDAVQMGTLKVMGKKIAYSILDKKDFRTIPKSADKKKKWIDNSGGQYQKKPNSGRMFTATTSRPEKSASQDSQCNRCGKIHVGDCWKCHMCNRFEHQTQYCFSKDSSSGLEKPIAGCFECGNMGHYRKDYPKLRKQNAKGRAFEINAKKARKDPSIVTGMFLINRHYAYVLFDTGADLSFVSKQFEPLLGIESSKLDTKYSIELANRKTIETGEVAEIVCSEKLIRLPLPSGETLTIQGEQGNLVLKLTSIMKTCKMLRKGYPAFLVNVVDTKAEGQNIEDIPIVRDYPEVFPKDLPGLPPPRQVEFRIDLVQDATPIARSPYRLASSEMQELSNQLQDLIDK
ncbi:uncharacterized protein LOC143623856 [Bidens hawaiensis]|uniref:uncharacterized protein LOC143623856 n=1 Tax=Bidens hawaiensis TaxID=980011 RepID=UPI00404ABF37